MAKMPRQTPTTTTITSRFQMHIPLAIRKKINLNRPTTANIWVEDDIIHVEPHYPKIMELAGVLRDKNPIMIPGLKEDLSNIRDFIDYSDL